MQSNRPVAHGRRPTPIIGLATLLVAGAWLSCPVPTRAQTKDSAIPPVVASTLDDQTVALLGVETTRLDLDSGLRQVSAIPILSERQRGDLQVHKQSLALWLDQFHKAGGREIWFVLTLADDLMNGPFAVVPLAEGANRQALEGLFVADKKLAGHPEMDYPITMQGMLEREGGLIFGANAALKRLGDFHGRTRAVPKAALDAVAGAEVRAFLLPTDDQRRVLREFLRDPEAERAIFAQMPQGTVPAEFLRNPGEIARLALGEGLQWVAAGVTTHDNLALKLVIGSKDNLSAKALDLWMAGAWLYARKHVAAQNSQDSAMIAGLIDQFSHLLAPKLEGDQLTIRVDMNQLMASAAGTFLGQAAFGAAQRAERTVVRNHLKQLALAMHNFHDVYKHFPSAAIRDAQGRPLLSWRVALLPFLEENQLYKQFHLDEPWDSEHNKALIRKMPSVFAPHSPRLRAEGKTTLLVPVGKQTIFGPPEGVSIREIIDGTSTTIMIVDADEARAVDWTKPADLNVDGVDAKQAVYGTRKEVVCAFADGSAHVLGPALTAEQVRALLTRNGREAMQTVP